MRVEIFEGDPIKVQHRINAWIRDKLEPVIVRTDCTYAEGEGTLIALVWYEGGRPEEEALGPDD